MSRKQSKQKTQVKNGIIFQKSNTCREYDWLLWIPVCELSHFDLDTKYLQDEYHFQIHSLWYLGMIPWIGACFTAYFGGQMSDWLRKKTGSLRIARSYFSIAGMICAAICFLIIPFT